MNQRNNSFRSRGFTTLELLTVVVIVGLLAMMSLPHAFRAKDRSHVGAAQSDLVTLRHALAVYAVDHDGYPLAIASYKDFEQHMVDEEGRPYVTLPTGETFRWVSYANGRSNSYSNSSSRDYLLVIQALDHKKTLIEATGDGIRVR